MKKLENTTDTLLRIIATHQEQLVASERKDFERIAKAFGREYLTWPKKK